MGASLRALRALVLLAGFYLLGVFLLAALGGIDYAVVTTLHGPVAGKLLLVSVVLAIPIVRGLFMLRTPKGEGPAGVTVGEAQEPELWAVVRDIAQQVGTRAPDEIVLIDEVNAAVAEDAKLLGLRPGTRRLYLGLPLMTGLDEMQLRAVLAHEMGHYANFDTRLTPLIARGRAQLIRTIGYFHERADKKVAKERAKQERKDEKRIAKGKKAKGVDTEGEGAMYRAMAKIYIAYGNFYMRATRSTSRRQELAADLASVRVIGRDSAASALRELNALDSAHDFYMGSYATLGVGGQACCPARARSSAACAASWTRARPTWTSCAGNCRPSPPPPTTPTRRSPSAWPASRPCPTTAAAGRPPGRPWSCWPTPTRRWPRWSRSSSPPRRSRSSGSAGRTSSTSP